MSRSFRFAFKRTIPIVVGFFPLGVAYGILMADAGYNFLWSGAVSLTVLAGSLQFLMVSFLTGSVPLVTVAVMALLLNSRHIFYGLSFIEKFKSWGALKYFLIFGLTDETYSLLCSLEPVEGVDEKKAAVIMAALVWLYWTAFSALGGLIGGLISFNTTGIDFALTALFVVILLDRLRGEAGAPPAVVAVVSSVLCILIFGAGNFILPSLVITSAALTALRPRLEPGLAKKEAE